MLSPTSTPSGSIRVLSPEVANQIAAGEVVERPASVVKELMENALDAGADTVRVEVLGGGIQMIRVEDNGQGMTEEDARLSVTRHATSKLTQPDDLLRIGTFGFRGEALPSIASVCRFSIRTATEGAECGVCLKMEGGPEIEVEPAPSVRGTTVEVSDLFFNTPARRKFLKRASTELSHIGEVITRLALVHPDRTFRFMAEGRTVLDIEPQTKFGDDPGPRLGQILGKATADRLRPLPDDGVVRAVGVRGFLGLPPLSERGNKGQYVSVNGRFVRDRTIQHAITEAYSGRLPKGKQPVVVLFITVDPREVDVNVHPQKTEVRFARSGEIYRTVHAALRRGLAEQPLQPIDSEADPAARRRMLLAVAERQVVSPPLPSVSETVHKAPRDRPVTESPREGAASAWTSEVRSPPSTPPESSSPLPVPAIHTEGWVARESQDAASSRYKGHSDRLLNAFRGINATPEATPSADPVLASPSSDSASSSMTHDVPSAMSLGSEAIVGPSAGSTVLDGSSASPVSANPVVQSSSSVPASLPLPAEDIFSARRLGVLWSRYLLLEASHTFWLIDLRGVALRVAQEEQTSPSLVAQALLLPLPLSFRNPSQLALVTEYKASLAKVGFELRLEERECMLLAAPRAAQGLSLEELFFEAVDALDGDQDLAECVSQSIRQRLSSSRPSVPVPTESAEIDALLSRWAVCSVRDTGPDGRPLMVVLKDSQIDQLFRGN